MKIPSIYETIAEKFYQNCLGDKINTERARQILRVYHRIPQEKILTVLRELSEYKLIKLCGTKFILVRWQPTENDI